MNAMFEARSRGFAVQCVDFRQFVLGVATLLLLIARFGHAHYLYPAGLTNGEVPILDSDTNTLVGMIQTSAVARGIAVGPDGRFLYVVDQCGSGNVCPPDDLKETTPGVVLVLDVTMAGAVNATIPVGPGPRGIAINPTGSHIYVVNTEDATLSVASTATKQVTATLDLPGAAPEGIAVNPAGTRVYVGAGNNVVVVDATTNGVIAAVPVGTFPRGLDVTPDGSRVYAVHCGDRPGCDAGSTAVVSAIDTTTNTEVATLSVGLGRPGGLAINPAGTRVYVATGGGTISVVDTTTNAVVSAITVGKQPLGVVFLPSGTKAYVTNFGSDSVSVIDTATETVTATVDLGTGHGSYALGRFVGPKPAGCQ